MVNVFGKFKEGLAKTRAGVVDRFKDLATGKTIDEEFFEELEEILIEADIGVETVVNLIEEVRSEVSHKKIKDREQVFPLLEEKLKQILEQQGWEINYSENGPTIILIVGVNGVGKTTSIAKLAYKLKNNNKRVLLAAADTFRAAAIEQLESWANDIKVPLIKHQEGADPGAVAFDAVKAAKSRNYDVVIIDTAGRLQNKKNLMDEVGKINRVIKKESPDAPHETLLVLDATTGQNAISQADTFNEVLDISGIILAKLDGTAKGGVVVSISKELGVPVKFVGLGEKAEDFEEFSAEEFAGALFDLSGGEELEG